MGGLGNSLKRAAAGVAAVVAGLIVSGLGAPGMAQGDGSGLASHRAVYTVRLKDPQHNSAYSSASGRFVVEWQRECGGFASRSRFVTEFMAHGGQALMADRRFSSWEAADGGTFRFSMENYLDEGEGEKARGTANRADHRLTFEVPAQRAHDLPEDVMFPSEHTRAILRAARAGQRMHRSVIFDGAEDGAVFNAVAFIGRDRMAGETGKGARLEPAASTSRLDSMAYWPVTLSYYERSKAADVPAYEISYRLYPNGISDGLTLDYGAFSLVAELQEVEFLDAPDCS